MLPDDFIRSARAWLGDEADAFLAACAEPPRLAVRPNRLKGGLDRLLPLLGAEAVRWPRVPWWPDTLLPPEGEDLRLAAHPLSRIGALYAQDPAALAAVAALDPRPGERILDLCAAPGGKSSAIADLLRGHGILVSNDVDRQRAFDLRWTLERWGAANSAVLSLAPERLAALAPGSFDRVLVDAPCSGEAMFARRERALADWSPGHVVGCAARQSRILASARLLVKPGGLIVYATCTFNPVENEGVIADYLAVHPDDTLEDAVACIPGALPGRPDLLPPDKRDSRLERCARLWTHRVPGAGHTVTAIRVGMEAASAPARRRVRMQCASRPTSDSGQEIRALVRALAPGLPVEGPIAVRGDSAFLVPPQLPAPLREAALAPGLQLAERPGRAWHPAHALAMALGPDQAAHSVHLDDDGMAAYLAGQQVAAPAGGVSAVFWHGYPLGWARGRGGVLTPLLPKGLRRPLA